jgi:hypothetical protein
VSWLRFLAHIALLAFVAGIAYKTGRGDAWDNSEAVAKWSRRARAAEEALQVMEDAWTQCILNEPIRYPGDTTLRLTGR